MEHLGIDAAGDDPQLRRVGRVELLELAGLDLARRDDGRRLPHRTALDLDAYVTLGVDVLVHHLALHEAQRVEHLDPRDAPLRREDPRDLGREPVVRVNEVVAKPLLRDVRVDPRCELVEAVVDVHLREVADRTGFDVDHPGAGHDLLDLGVIVLPLPGVHVDLDAATREIARQLADVHVHPARVAATELRHRTRVYGQHRHPHQVRSASSLASQRSRAPRSYLYGSPPRRRSYVRYPCAIASRIAQAWLTMPTESVARPGS